MEQETLGMTRRLARFISQTDESTIPADIYEHAKVAFMDWLGVTMAGKDEPLVDKLIKYAQTMGGNEQATIIGRGMRMSMAQATLINGAASHALDYDDSLPAFLGHPSVTLFPGALALSEWYGKNGADFLTAFIIGLKAGVTVGMCAGGQHYMSGYHGTATIGTLAAAAACSRLMGLDEQQTLYALGIAGTQSAGLKGNFGTMCKPFHPGRAAEAGLMATLLAEDDFSSAEDILEGPAGFFAAMRGGVNEDVLNTLGQTWVGETLAQKYHASCHATHSPLEAARAIVREHGLSVSDIEAVKVFSSPVGLSAAFRIEANTGLEGKFSIPYTVANALLRTNTGMQAFTDEMVADPEVQALMKKITTDAGDPEVAALDAKVEITATDGRVFTAKADVFKDVPSLEIKKEKIRDKFVDLAEPVVGPDNAQKLASAINSLEEIEDMNVLTRLMK